MLQTRTRLRFAQTAVPALLRRLLPLGLLAALACAPVDRSDGPLPVPPDQWLGDFRIGLEIDPEGVVAPADHAERFVRGMTVHYSMRVLDAPDDGTVTVEWAREDESVAKIETATVDGRDTLDFLTGTSDWQPGTYSVVTRISGETVDERYFDVVEVSGSTGQRNDDRDPA